MSTQFVEVNDGKIAYDDNGSGPLVICAPSMGDLRGEYRFLTPLLVSGGFRVATMDVRGHGETSPTWPDYSVAGVGQDLVDLAHSLEGGPAVLVGTSMAAGAAVWAAAEAPELVAGLILIGPFVRGGSNWQGKLLSSLVFTRPWGPRLWLSYYTRLYPTHKPEDFAQYRAALQANLKEPGRMEALQAMLSASKDAAEKRMPQVKATTLVLMGSKDSDFKDPEAEANWVASGLHGNYQMLKDAGHYPHAEMPEATSLIMLSFLQELKERQHAAQTWVK